MTSIDRSAAPRRLAQGSPTWVPALLVGRLAVDRRAAGRGLGTSLVRHILAVAVEINTAAACRAVVVGAFDPDAYRWWQQLGFTPLEPDDDTDASLYLLTEDIQRTIDNLTGHR